MDQGQWWSEQTWGFFLASIWYRVIWDGTWLLKTSSTTALLLASVFWQDVVVAAVIAKNTSTHSKNNWILREEQFIHVLFKWNISGIQHPTYRALFTNETSSFLHSIAPDRLAYDQKAMTKLQFKSERTPMLFHLQIPMRHTKNASYRAISFSLKHTYKWECAYTAVKKAAPKFL